MIMWKFWSTVKINACANRYKILLHSPSLPMLIVVAVQSWMFISKEKFSCGWFYCFFFLVSPCYFPSDIIKRRKGRLFVTKSYVHNSCSLAMLLFRTHGCFFCQAQQLKAVEKGYICQSTSLWVLNYYSGKLKGMTVTYWKYLPS